MPSDCTKLALEECETVLMEQHGRTMKEYVVVPFSLLAGTEALSEYLRKSHEYVAGLKPKPTKR